MHGAQPEGFELGLIVDDLPSPKGFELGLIADDLLGWLGS